MTKKKHRSKANKPGLYFITGIAATGKSTIAGVLTQRGYLAYDGDLLAKHYHIKTGEVAPRKSKRDKKFYKTHEWKIKREEVEKLAREAQEKEKPVFLCGAMTHPDEVWDLFEGVVSLKLNKKTLIKRLRTRKTNDYGKSKKELKRILSSRKQVQAKNKGLGAIILNGDQEINKLINKIFKAFSLSV